MKLQRIRTAGTSLAAGVAVTLMFALACYSLYLNRTATAAVAAAMTLALVLIRQLNVLESFEILSLKAKFIARIGDADTLLAHIRRSASVSSKLSYVQLAFMNRMGDIGWPRKRALLEEIDGLLREVDVPQADIAAMKAPFLNLVTLDLSRVFEHSVHEMLRPKRQALEEEIRSYSSKPIVANDPKWSKLLEERQNLERSAIDWQDALGNTALANLRQALTVWAAKIPLDGPQKQIADQILDEVATLSEACWTAGTVTTEAEDYLNRYGTDTNERIKAL